VACTSRAESSGFAEPEGCHSEPGLLAEEIVENLEAALEQFRAILEDLGEAE
jgi:hypothetical protein